MQYKNMLHKITNRMKLIEQLALESDRYNEEYIELCHLRNSLYKLAKLEAKDDNSQ